MQHQLSFTLIEHQTDHEVIPQRARDGYINATALCKVEGKLFADYHRLSTTQGFLSELSRSMGIPIDQLVQSITIGPNHLRGTWAHPQVAINLGQWLSPKFAVLVSKWVSDWMSGKGSPNLSKAKLPYHIERHLVNLNSVPHGHFSILQEITFHLIAPFEQLGYTIPARMMPDISEGRMFCKYARDELGIDTDAFPTYIHRFTDGRPPVKPKAYPNDLLPAFRNVIVPQWLSKKAFKYFKDRDPKALPYLDKLLLLAAPSEPTAVIPRWRKKKKPAA
ncbi:MAG: KilA-N domain-containing protein [Candidatus Thiodiazotropha endolucinida]